MAKKLSRPRLLVVVSDLHCGSNVGLMPPDSEIIGGNTIGFGSNHHQRWLWECWQDAQKQVAKLAETAIEFPPMQKGASFNLDAVKAKIEAARAAMGK